MKEKIEPRLLKGFKDYGPQEQLVRQQMFSKIQSVFERFGFLPLSTPVLEYKEILMGKYGDDEKLVYSFKDNGDRDVAMRYDLTVPLARYVAQNQGQLTLPFKRYQIAPVWRADNPQKGRLREFYQCDVDAVGTDSLLADAEVIACLCQALEAVGVSNYVVRLNNRSVFKDLPKEAVMSIDKIDKIGFDGVVEDMKSKGLDNNVIDKAKAIIENTASGTPPEINELTNLIYQLRVNAPIISDPTLTNPKEADNFYGNVVFDPHIARGLDYYTGTVFEIFLTDKQEYGSVCSGGRYDGLVDQFSKEPLPAVGGSIGIDRLLQALAEMGTLEVVQPIKALVLNQNEALEKEYVSLVAWLRSAGVNIEMYYSAAAKLDKQFKYAESKQIPYAIIMGETELQDGTVQLKNLSTREQETVTTADLAQKLQ